MKNKISFTAVLKDKAISKHSMGYSHSNNHSNINTHSHSQQSQASCSSQPKYPTLSEMLEQFQIDSSQQFTINLNQSYAYNQRSRNSSINMVRSRNVQEDPQNNGNVNFENWIESMTHSNRASQQIKNPFGLNIKTNIDNTNISTYGKGKSMAKPVKVRQENKDYFQPENQHIQQGQHQHQNQQAYMLHSKENRPAKFNHFGEKNQQIMPKVQIKPIQNNGNAKNIQIKSKTISEDYANNVTQVEPENEQKKAKLTMEKSAQQVLSQCQFKSKEHFPDVGYGEYDYLKLQFDQLKQQKLNKVSNYNYNGKNSIKRQKVEDLVGSIMKSIYSQIESMANTIKNQKQKLKSTQSLHDKSEQMLLESEKNNDNNNDKEEEKIENSFDQREEMIKKRIQEYKGKVSGVICEIDNIKSKGNQNNYGFGQVKTFRNINHEVSYQEPSFRRQQNCFNDYQNQHYKKHQHKTSKNPIEDESSYSNHIANNSVGYSFSNNQICEHSFNNDLSSNNNNNNQYYHNSPYYQTTIQRQQQKKVSQEHMYIYRPENQLQYKCQEVSQDTNINNNNSKNDQGANFSLPNIDQVKSEHGEYDLEQRNGNGYNFAQVQSSEEIQYRNKRKPYPVLQVDNQCIKNIQSVNYQPDVQGYSYGQDQNNLPLQSSYKPHTHYQQNQMFKQFQSSNSNKNGCSQTQEQKQHEIEQKETYKYNHIEIKRRQCTSPNVQTKAQFTRDEQQQQYSDAKGGDNNKNNNSTNKKKQTFFSNTFNSYLSGNKDKYNANNNNKFGSNSREQAQDVFNFNNKLQSSIHEEEPIRQTCEVQLSVRQSNEQFSNPATTNIITDKKSFDFKFNSPKNTDTDTDTGINDVKINTTQIEQFSSQNHKNQGIKKQESPYAVAKDIAQYNSKNTHIITPTQTQNYSYKASLDRNNRLVESKEVYEKTERQYDKTNINGGQRNGYEFYYKEQQNHSNQYANTYLQACNGKQLQASSLLQMKPLEFNNHSSINISISNQKMSMPMPIQTSTSVIPEQHKKAICIPTSLNKMQINQSIQVLQEKVNNIVITTTTPAAKQIKLSISKYQTSKQNKHISVISNHVNSSHSRTFSEQMAINSCTYANNKQKSSSPKVIEINLQSQVKGLSIKPYEEIKPNEHQNHVGQVRQQPKGEKQNIFHKLSIKESMNLELDKVQDNTKQNHNTMNKNEYEDLSVQNQIQKQKKQPLIKLSRNAHNTTSFSNQNMNGSISQHQSSYGIKKSITDSHGLNRNSKKINTNMSIKQSRQSVNSSGMDFDLALD